MPSTNEIVSHIAIKIKGENLPQAIFSNLLEVVVDQQVHLPSMFTIRLHDPGLKILDEGPFQFQTPIKITAQIANKPVELLVGEVTALEPDFGEGMSAELLIRGYDLTHRLYRESRSTTYQNVKDSDLATEFAGKAKLTPEVEATQTVYDHLYQHNQSDLHFLMQRAWRIGYECFVDGGKLIFRKPKLNAAAATLKWGEDLLLFRPRMTLAEQVKKVQVKGWDAQKKIPIIGTADAGVLYPNIADQSRDLAKQDGKLVLVDQDVASQAEADILALARLNELSGSYIEAEGEAFRRPDIRAGRVVKLEALGKRFSGDYLVTSATHVYTAGGMRTSFSVRGLRTGLLLAQMTDMGAGNRWPGVVPAIVTNTDDPKKWGRVRVKYPWLSDEDESDWARVVSTGGGPEAGFFITPAVDDEVLVAFVHGNFGQPVVVGGLWNGIDAVPPSIADIAEGERPLVRTWHSRTGHQISMYDNADNKVHIATTGGHRVTLDDAGHKITVVSKGGLELVLDDDGKEIKITSGGKVTVKASGDVQVEAGNNLQLKANGNLQIEAQGNLQMRAMGTAKLESTAQVTVSAPQISLG